ncbi:MAG: hypothetical protein ABIS35_03950 [Terracoccus sp.]
MTTPAPPSPSVPEAGPARSGSSNAARLCAALVALEALVLLGFVGFYGYGIASGGTSDTVRAVTSGLLILVFAVGLLVVARGWVQAKDWPRTPTVLWNALLLPVGWSLWQSERPLLAAAVAALAALTIITALAGGGRAAGAGSEPDRDEGTAEHSDERPAT